MAAAAAEAAAAAAAALLNPVHTSPHPHKHCIPRFHTAESHYQTDTVGSGYSTVTPELNIAAPLKLYLRLEGAEVLVDFVVRQDNLDGNFVVVVQEGVVHWMRCK